MLGGRFRPSPGSSATAVRFIAILTAVCCCLAAAAYATVRSVGPGPAAVAGGERSPLRPRIVVHPDSVTTQAVAEFDFSQPGRPPRKARPGPPPLMECRLDAGPWRPCAAPVSLTVRRGGHRFAVHAVNRAGDIGPAAAFLWRRTAEAKGSPPVPSLVPRPPATRPTQPSSTTPPASAPPSGSSPVEGPGTHSDGPPFVLRQIGTLGELLPGAPAETIGVLIENPNQAPITVTSLTAAIVTDPPDCPAAENFELTPAAVSSAAPLVVPGESTLSLPEAGVAGPTIAMTDLPHSQDACQGEELEIALSGTGRG